MVSVARTSNIRPRLDFLRRSAVAAVTLLLLQLVPQANQAQAQGFGYDYGYSQQWWKPANKKQKPQKARANKRPGEQGAKAAKTVAAVPEKPVTGPLVLVVSLRLQRVTVYNGPEIIATSPISSGRVGNPTPLGVFSILEKQKVHFSNLYASAPMPNMQRITWSGVAMHAGVLPGYPASHGCIRLPHGFSQRLFNLTKTGARVIVTRDDVPVQSFSHQALFTTTALDGLAKTGAVAIPGSGPSSGPSSGEKVADASGRTVGADKGGSGLIGIGSAQAAADFNATEATTVSPYRQKWLVEMDKRSQGLVTALAAKEEAVAKIPATVQASELAKSDFKAMRLETERLAQTLKKTENELNLAEKELDAFAKPLLAERRLTDEEIVSTAEREEALDKNLGELTTAITTQTAEVAAAGELLKSAEQRALTAESERKAALNGLTQANAGLKAAQGLVDEAKRREAKRQLPVAIFISRQTKKLYVRQGYAPILETPIDIAEPDKPLGTQVYTALAVAPNNRDMIWSVATVPTGAVVAADERSKDKKRKKDAPVVPSPAPHSIAGQTPAAALDRITIPQEVREQIADVLKPGSSLLVSDYGLSNETGLFTDFIVGLR